MDIASWPKTLVQALSLFFYVFHTLFILFNLLGWIWKRSQRLHFYAVCITLFSWLVVGFWKGFGYCFLTDWHYDLLQVLGEENLPKNYIAFLVQQIIGWLPPESLISWSIAVGMTSATLASIWVNFFNRK